MLNLCFLIKFEFSVICDGLELYNRYLCDGQYDQHLEVRIRERIEQFKVKGEGIISQFVGCDNCLQEFQFLVERFNTLVS